ncbi:uncharacterized protein LOC114281149 [Camellia sinensis]|uniref:uncharacterized protein LOC114281149 n=1 Tax=Camellia sinensis TaxID=4442 RepID=UPI0010360583|nr:uncharacterized protein LOC114281149 [Camellia sinensis]
MRKIKKNLANKKVDIVLIQETKKVVVITNLVRSMWPSDCFEFMSIDAKGRARGLLCIWNPEQSWSKCRVEGWAGFKCLMKLKTLKLALKQWNGEVFGKVETRLKNVEDEAHALDLLAEERSLLGSEINSRNYLSSILVNGSIIEEPMEIRAKVKAHFMSAQVVEQLEAKFIEEEIRNVIKRCEGNKAPRPDGFNMAFFKKCWGIVKSDVLQFMMDFHQNASFVGGINSSFIALILKSNSPSCLNDYRPISLIGSMYKLLAKVLLDKLKLIMPKIIGEVQSSFLGGRNILDGVLIPNEIVNGWRKSNSKGLVLKLGFEKAYDSINWEFLFSMLLNFGFGDNWVRWIRACVSSAKIFVLVNGSPTSKFSPQRAEWVEVVNIKRILGCFEILSGLKINYHKSVICGIGVDDGLLHEFANRLNCLHQKLPLKYLGMRLGANPGRKSTWKPILDKCMQKLASWKRRLLSFARRLTLIKYVMSSLPIYYLSLFKIPVGVAKEIEKMQSAFLWGGSDLKRKVH